MPRPTSPRNVGYVPETIYFKPAGISMTEIAEVILRHDELEAIRLKNILHLSQDEAAVTMNVSQPTFHRLISAAYEKVADAIVNGKALRIEGGNISLSGASLPVCGSGWRCKRENNDWSFVQDGVEAAGNVTAIKQAEKSQKILITSADGTLGGMVDERFGRARKLVIYDLGVDTFTVQENVTQLNLPNGAGIRTAHNVITFGVKAVISGHFGPKAFNMFQGAGIEAYSALGITVAEAVRRYRKGNLCKLSRADVDGHW